MPSIVLATDRGRNRGGLNVAAVIDKDSRQHRQHPDRGPYADRRRLHRVAWHRRVRCRSPLHDGVALAMQAWIIRSFEIGSARGRHEEVDRRCRICRRRHRHRQAAATAAPPPVEAMPPPPPPGGGYASPPPPPPPACRRDGGVHAATTTASASRRRIRSASSGGIRPGRPAMPLRATDGLAIASLIVGILSLVCTVGVPRDRARADRGDHGIHIPAAHLLQRRRARRRSARLDRTGARDRRVRGQRRVVLPPRFGSDHLIDLELALHRNHFAPVSPLTRIPVRMLRARPRARRSRYNVSYRLTRSVPAAIAAVLLLAVMVAVTLTYKRFDDFISATTGHHINPIGEVVQAVEPRAGHHRVQAESRPAGEHPAAGYGRRAERCSVPDGLDHGSHDRPGERSRDARFDPARPCRAHGPADHRPHVDQQDQRGIRGALHQHHLLRRLPHTPVRPAAEMRPSTRSGR